MMRNLQILKISRISKNQKMKNFCKLERLWNLRCQRSIKEATHAYHTEDTALHQLMTKMIISKCPKGEVAAGGPAALKRKYIRIR
jgi:hypothetical protein